MKIFRNGYIVDIESGTAKLADILVGDDGKIKEIGKKLKADCKEVDLEENYVMPAFVNSYCNSDLAVSNSFECGVGKDLQELARQLVFVKNLLSGAVFLNDKPKTIEKIEDYSESELSKMSENFAKTKERFFAKVGLDLFELGAIDKQYKKSLAEVLEEFGFLDRDCVLVGGNCFEKDELKIFKRYDTPIVLTPNEDGRVGRRMTNINALRFLDFDIMLGSGDYSEIDFFAFMRQLILGQRQLFEDSKILSEKDALNMACNSSLMGFENKIKVGNLAHFAVVAKEQFGQKDVLKEIVWRKNKKDVLMTIFKGEILQKSGKILMKNLPQYDKIISEIQQRLRRN